MKMTLANQFPRWTRSPWSPKPVTTEQTPETAHDAYRFVRLAPNGNQVVAIPDANGDEHLYLADDHPGEQLFLTRLDKDTESYTVSEVAGRWLCTCKDYLYRQSKRPDGICKHGKCGAAGLHRPF